MDASFDNAVKARHQHCYVNLAKQQTPLYSQKRHGAYSAGSYASLNLNHGCENMIHNASGVELGIRNDCSHCMKYIHTWNQT